LDSVVMLRIGKTIDNGALKDQNISEPSENWG
jgi:hypothetical protein